MATLYLTFGPTHSGKTTFGKALYAEFLRRGRKIIHVDNDVVEAFVRDNYDNLRTDPEVLARRTPTDPDLRLRIPQLIVSYALGEGYDVVVTASHSKEVIRRKYLRMATAVHADTVLLEFTTSEPELLRRLRTSGREDLSLNAHSFEDLVKKQKTLLHPPTEEECKLYAKIITINERNSEEMLARLVENSK